MIEFKRHIVTSALPYANGPLHIGHLAGAYLPADIYVRFQRMMGKDILFICGSDEHGAAITMRAIKEGKTPKDIIDTYHASFLKTFKGIGISFDYYHRTSSQLHHETSQEFFTNLYNKKEFVEKESEQYFDVEANQFLADRYIIGTCPKCANPDAYGDQCEKCGSSLSPTELINPRSVLSGSKPELRKTTHWFLPLDTYEPWIREWIETGVLDGNEHHDPESWKAHVLGQCKSWIEGGLQARAMTRDLDWGVDVPQHIPGSQGKKLYVWMDAPIGYISATKQWAAENGKDWKAYWQDPESELIHFIGKDNIVFHCIIFPAILKAHGGYNLPTNVPANQFMNLEGKKISTSRNWAVWVHEFLEELPGLEDSLRYYLIKNMPEQKDSEFLWKGFQEAHNNELVNNLANFVNRVLVLTQKYFEGKVPDFDPDESINGPSASDMDSFHDSEMLSLFDRMQDLGQHIRDYNFRAALSALMELSTAGNQILQNNEPWKQAKDNPELVQVCLNLCLQYVHAIAIAVRPFMPNASDRICTMLNIPLLTENNDWNDALDKIAEGELILPVGHALGTAEYLFTRIDDAVIQTQIQKLDQSAEQTSAMTHVEAIQHAPLKELISYDDFTKMDIRTARILQAEKVEKADKLLKLLLDLGFEQRTVVSGIAEHFKPEDIIGKDVLILANLEPRKIKGIESKGMILMADSPDGKLSFVSPTTGWLPGFVVK